MAFKEGLATLGWKGPQITIDERWADYRNERLLPLAEELAARNPALIVVASSRVVAAAVKAAPRTPIVAATSGDLVAAGFAASLARPGGLVTGLTNLRPDFAGKYLELLLSAAPYVKRVGVLADSKASSYAQVMPALRRSLAQFRVQAQVAEATTPEEIDAAMTRLAKDGAQGLLVVAGGVFLAERQRIVKFALSHRWPVVAGEREFTEEGALLSYGIDTVANYRRAAWYVDRILKGARPGDLPVEQPTKFELVINFRTAKALGITVPQELLLRADRVIE